MSFPRRQESIRFYRFPDNIFYVNVIFKVNSYINEANNN